LSVNFNNLLIILTDIIIILRTFILSNGVDTNTRIHRYFFGKHGYFKKKSWKKTHYPSFSPTDWLFFILK
jgi:hypothetical protein